jgi:hypothetical protein
MIRIVIVIILLVGFNMISDRLDTIHHDLVSIGAK